MCHASLAAYTELVDLGLISPASMMVPCPWFPATADVCRASAPDWRCRVADHKTFRNPVVRDYVKSSGMQVIGWRILRSLMRGSDQGLRTRQRILSILAYGR
jgi:hypothetical protein